MFGRLVTLLLIYLIHYALYIMSEHELNGDVQYELSEEEQAECDAEVADEVAKIEAE